MINATEAAMRQERCVNDVLDVLARHDPAAVEQIEKHFAHGARKWSVRGGAVAPQDEFMLILAEATASLAKLVDQQAEANQPPKRRGRKPNVEFTDS